jgi:hypothetical protein
MKRSPLGKLVGRLVRKVLAVEDYLQIHFEFGTSLNIYNPMLVSGTASGSLTDIEGHRVSRVSERPDSASLEFDDGTIVTIDLRDEAFVGPEAMVLEVPGEPIVVWN